MSAHTCGVFAAQRIRTDEQASLRRVGLGLATRVDCCFVLRWAGALEIGGAISRGIARVASARGVSKATTPQPNSGFRTSMHYGLKHVGHPFNSCRATT